MKIIKVLPDVFGGAHVSDDGYVWRLPAYQEEFEFQEKLHGANARLGPPIFIQILPVTPEGFAFRSRKPIAAESLKDPLIKQAVNDMINPLVAPLQNVVGFVGDFWLKIAVVAVAATALIWVAKR